MIIKISGTKYYICDRANPDYETIEHKNKQWTAGDVLRQDIGRQDTISINVKTMPLKNTVTGNETDFGKFTVTRYDTESTFTPIGAMSFFYLIKGVGGFVTITDNNFYDLNPFYAIITLGKLEFLKTGGVQSVILNFKVEEC